MLQGQRARGGRQQQKRPSAGGDIPFTFAAQNAGRFSASAAMKGEKLNLRIKNLER